MRTLCLTDTIRRFAIFRQSTFDVEEVNQRMELRSALLALLKPSITTHSVARLLVLLLLCLPSCGFGPRALVQTRLPYNEAVKRTSEEQFLLNIVRLRYTDTPSSLAISSIADQQELSSGLQAIPFLVSGDGGIFRTNVLPQAEFARASRPTLSYTPLDDEEFTRRLFTPISLQGVLYLSKTTWPISTVLRLYLENLNWVSNAETASGPTPKCAPEYAVFLEGILALQELQDAQLVQLHIDEKDEVVAGPFDAPSNPAEIALKAADLKLELRVSNQQYSLIKKYEQPLLAIDDRVAEHPAWSTFCECFRIDPSLRAIELTNEELTPYEHESSGKLVDCLDIETRSLLQVLFFVSHGIDVPEEHIRNGQAPLTCTPDGLPFDWQQVLGGLFHVRTVKSKKRPPNAYVAVHYDGYWYYIDEKDRDTKSTFALLLEVSRLELQPTESRAPMLTLPIGR